MNEWISVKSILPRQGETVYTKVDDELNGERNVVRLKLVGRLWYLPADSTGSSMYIYYSPTHWKPIK